MLRQNGNWYKRFIIAWNPEVICLLEQRRRWTGAVRRSRLSSRQYSERMKGRGGMNPIRVLVVDDILTTGSTISEVARQLKIAGATNGYGLVVASPKYILQMENNAI